MVWLPFPAFTDWTPLPTNAVVGSPLRFIDLAPLTLLHGFHRVRVP